MKDVVDVTVQEEMVVPAGTPAVEEVNVIPTETPLPVGGTTVIFNEVEEDVDIPVNVTVGAMLCKLLTVQVDPIAEPVQAEMVDSLITQGLVMSAPVRSQPGV